MADVKTRVVIVGGGVGGLALASSLQHAGIDYVLVERQDQLAPPIGASIGILPNGARILDQLGCYDYIGNETVSMKVSRIHSEDGSMIGKASDTLNLVERRTGYPVFFLPRRLLIEALTHSIKDKSRIMLGVKVRSIESLEDRAVVNLSDGTSLQGDLVVGADGTYSTCRHEMWRLAGIKGDEALFQNDRKALKAEYKCLFGMSGAIPGMNPGETGGTYAKNMSTLSYVGKEGVIFWFVFVKMDGIYQPPSIPRFGEADVEKLVESIGHLPIRGTPKVTISDLYKVRTACDLVAIEEGDFQQWSYDRIVCLGDAVHKFTPNLGAGASSALESAAALSNKIVKLMECSTRPSTLELGEAFEQYKNERMMRVTRAAQLSNRMTRVQSLQTKMDYIFTHYIAPRNESLAAERFCGFVVGAEIVDHLPVPARSLQGTMPFNPKQGWGHEETYRYRLKQAIPLLGLACLYLLQAFTNRSVTFSSGRQGSTPAGLDGSSLSDAVYAIWLLEGARVNNQGTLAQFPMLFGLASQKFGMSATSILYFFVLYMVSSVEKFKARDRRLTDTRYSATTGLLVLLHSALPMLDAVLQGKATADSSRYWITRVWPINLSGVHLILASCLGQSPIPYNRLKAVKQDIPWIRISVATVAILFSATRAVNIYHTLVSINWTSQFGASTLLQRAIYEHVDYLSLCTTFWLLLTYQDFKRAGMIDWGTGKFLLSFAVTTLVLGPSVMLVTGWLVREEILSSRRHRDAVVDRFASSKISK